jgi:hypothetical protein
MSSKKKMLVSLILVLATIAGIAFASGYVVKGLVNSPAFPNSPTVPQAALQDSVQIPAHSSQKVKPEVAEVNNVSVSLSNVSATATAINVEVCIQLPSTENWIPEASLIMGGQTISAEGWGLLNSKDPATYTSSNRCYQLDFMRPEGVQIDGTPAKVTVERLFIPPPIVPTKEQCAAAQQKLDAASKGINFTCWYPEGGGGWGYDVLKKPQGMSDDQVAASIYEALREKVVEGPWEFALNIVTSQ